MILNFLCSSAALGSLQHWQRTTDYVISYEKSVLLKFIKIFSPDSGSSSVIRLVGCIALQAVHRLWFNKLVFRWGYYHSESGSENPKYVGALTLMLHP